MRECPGALDHRRREVDPRGVTGDSREGAHADPRPAGDIENRVLRAGSDKLHEEPQGLLVPDGLGLGEGHGLPGELVADQVLV